MAADDVRQVVFDVLSDPMNIPSTFWDYATQSWLKDAPVFPISQVFGFAQFTANYAAIATAESTTSNTFTDLATVGPSLTGLPDGKYLIFQKVQGSTTNTGSYAVMGLSLNGAAPASTDTIGTRNADPVTFAGFTIASLSNGGSNTVTAKYRAESAGTASFEGRAVAAFKFSNL